ncbi:MAG TPA: hypothetical protein VF077_07270, partial [Nitrospiraceae bacterium]
MITARYGVCRRAFLPALLGISYFPHSAVSIYLELACNNRPVIAPQPALHLVAEHPYNTPPCEACMPFTIRRHCRFPVT